MAILSTIKNTADKRTEDERIRQAALQKAAAQQGASQGAATGTTSVAPQPTGATSENTGTTAYQQYLAAQERRAEIENQLERNRIMTSGTTQERNALLQKEANQRFIDQLNASGNTQAAAGMQQMMNAEEQARILSSGNRQQINQYLIDQAKAQNQQNAFQAAVAAANPTTTSAAPAPSAASKPSVNVTGTNRNTSSGEPVSPTVQAALGTPQPAGSQPAKMKDYIWYSWMGNNDMHTMNDDEKQKWSNAMAGYQLGDYRAFNQDFQTAGNWGSYVDDNGNVSGMLRYAGDGIGGYLPVNNGRVMAGLNPDREYLFYGPGGEVYTADANGNLTRSGNWTADYDQVMKNGYYYNDPNRMFQGKDGQFYTYADVPDDKLAEWGYVRRNDGLFYEPQTIATNKALESGQVTREQLAQAQAAQALRDGAVQANIPSSAGTNAPAQNAYQQYLEQATQNTQPAQNQPVQATVTPRSYQPTPSDRTIQGGDQNNPGIYQSYLDEWEYGPAPQWENTEYQRQRDEALRRAQNLRFSYDPESDPVWQAYQKQYRREGQRAMQDTMAEAAMRTGGLANSYAVSAAAQAGNYYAAELSDRLPQLYNDAYQRYLAEFQRQLGISDQYAGFDQTEYGRYADQLGQWNKDRSFDYGLYRDRVGDARYADELAYDRAWNEENRDYSRSYQAHRDAISDQRYDQQWAQQLREYADQQNWKATEWQQYLREYGDKMSQQEREWAYQQYRDAVGDQQYADQQAWNERKYADALAQQDWENSLTEDKYNRSVEDTAQSQAEERALRYAALGNYGPLAELWGMTEDEVAAYINGQQGGSGGGNSGGSSGGGSGSESGSGGGYSGGGGNVYDGDVTKGGVYDVNGQPMTTERGIIHDTNHEPMTSGFREWWPTLRDAFDAGASSQELAQAVDTLYRNGIIAEYEIDVILDKLGLDSTNSLTQKVQNKIYDTKQAAKRAKSGESAIDNLTSKIKSKIAEAKSKNGG